MDLETLKNDWLCVPGEEINIMGKPNFACGIIAERMRTLGFQCNRKAENEQALTIWLLLKFYKQYGDSYIEKVNDFLKSIDPEPAQQ